MSGWGNAVTCHKGHIHGSIVGAAACDAEPDAAPFERGSETSQAAAAAVTPEKLTADERIVVGCIVGAGSLGRTCDEIEIATKLTHQSASARIRGLVLKGVLVDGQTQRITRGGRRATVWTLKRKATQ